MIYIGIALFIFCADYAIKGHMEKTLADGEVKKRMGGFLRLRKHHNRGAFLNAGEKKRPLVAAVSVLLTLSVTVLFLLSLGTQGNVLLKTGLSMLLGGAFSNTYDRLRRKYVVDYLSFGVKWKWFGRIVFNISDFCIIIGAFLASLSAGGK